MKKTLKIFFKIVLFIAAFGVALWVFIPWREVGTAAFSIGAGMLEKQGVRLNFSGVDAVDGGFTVRDLSLAGVI